jgi:thiol-disulfide isomerase/thioredoxin
MCRGTFYLALVSCGSFAAAAIPAAELPRYKLEVGQDLTYSGSDEFKYQNGKFITETKWRVWVVRQNPEGCWRLILQNSTKDRQERDAGGGSEDETVTFAWTDLSPDGSLTENDSFGYRLNPYTLFIRLPNDAAAADSGWTQPHRRMDEINRYTFLADRSTNDTCFVRLVRESPMNAIYGFEFEDIATFDNQRGLPVKIESRSKQTYGFQGEGTGTLKLGEVKQQSEEWCRGFADDADRYFTVLNAFNQRWGDSDEPPDELEGRMKKAVADLRGAKEQIKSPEFQRQIDHVLAEHEKIAKYYVERATKRQATLKQPAFDWSCEGLDGKSHALKDYRGRVVVLDFWYRGCGWCIRAMPQMKQIAQHFADQPVTIFGMNTDRKEEDAQFVIEKMGLNYTNLKATGIPEKYGVSGFPTLLILDQEGMVRDIHVGYAPDLKEKVSESIERLLAKKE